MIRLNKSGYIQIIIIVAIKKKMYECLKLMKDFNELIILVYNRFI